VNHDSGYIRYGFDEDELFGVAVVDPRRYDLEKCKGKFESLCYEALTKKFPYYKIDILRMSLSIEVNGSTDHPEVEEVRAICNAVYDRYGWEIKRTIWNAKEASQRFKLSPALIYWACEEGIILEAEKVDHLWDFPLDTFSEFLDRLNTTANSSVYQINRVDGQIYLKGMNLDEILELRVNELFIANELLLIPNKHLGISWPFSSENSLVSVTIHQHLINRTVKYYLTEIWAGTDWSFETYTNELMSQVREASSCKTVTHTNLSLYFEFGSKAQPSQTLKDIIIGDFKLLTESSQDAESKLSGRFRWKSMYESNEDLFCTEVLFPLLNHMGYKKVKYTHGQKEYGKDFTFSEMTLYGLYRHYGLQAKAGNMSGAVKSSIHEILTQMLMSFGMPYYELDDIASERYISTFIIAISGNYADNAKDLILKMVPNDKKGSVHFWDKNTILQLAAQYWPPKDKK
jgi:hypothetical protein